MEALTGTATFTIPGEDVEAGDVLHLYPFFYTPGTVEYSRSVYFRVEDGGEGA